MICSTRSQSLTVERTTYVDRCLGPFTLTLSPTGRADFAEFAETHHVSRPNVFRTNAGYRTACSPPRAA